MKSKFIQKFFYLAFIAGLAISAFSCSDYLEKILEEDLPIPSKSNESVTITLNANGGQFITEVETVKTVKFKADKNSVYTLSSSEDLGLSRENYVFSSWAVSSTGTGTNYCDGDTILVTRSTTLYAIWTKTPYQKVNIAKDYWGTWIQMDTGDEYYFDSDAVYKSYGNILKAIKIQNNADGYTFDTKNVLKKGSTVYFRKGGTARDFSVSISGFSDTKSRAVSTLNGIKVKRQNQNNESDTETITPQIEGNSLSATTLFSGAIADDTQDITVIPDILNKNSSTSEPKILSNTISVTPKFDGENMGTIPLIEEGMYGFKTTYTIDSDDGYCYGNNSKTYDLNLNFWNIGEDECSTSVYEISSEDPKLFISSTSGNFSTIEAGSSKNTTIQVQYGKLEAEYVDVPLKIKITDSKYIRTWTDSITLRFYNGTVRFKVNSRNFNNSTAELKGFLIYPDGHSKRFTVSAGKSVEIPMPWSKEDYILAFSGASDGSTEMGYSFAIGSETNVADLSGTWSIDEINAYESGKTDESITDAARITDLSKPAKAYLKPKDIDFYVINNSGISVTQ